MHRIFTLVTTLFLFSAGTALAEGMYIPLAKKLPAEQIKEMGFSVTPQKIEKIANNSVVWISPGCSSTLMSKDGLIGTNWHCARRCASGIQNRVKNEEGENHPLAKISENGFVAENRSGELKCEGQIAKIPLKIQNVSREFRKFEEGKKLNPIEAKERIRRKKEALREKCQGKGEKYLCDVVFMNNEKDPYYLIRYKRFTDVRLVWIPSDIIGGFGGMYDNWEYPRHVGDFAFLRLYENGKPYRSSKHASVSRDGVKPGDPQFILGYPGSTERNITSYALEFMRDVELPYKHKVFNDFSKTISKYYSEPKSSPYSAAWFYLENYRENFKRKADMIRDLKVVQEKRKKEKESAQDRAILSEIEQLYKDREKYFHAEYLLTNMTNRRTPAKSILAAAHIWSWANQPSEDRDRKDERYKSWNRERLLAQVKNVDNFSEMKGEVALLARYFRFADRSQTRIRPFDRLKAETKSMRAKKCQKDSDKKRYGSVCSKSLYRAMAHQILRNSKMIAKNSSKAERERARKLRLEMFEMSPKELVRTNDSLLLFAKEIVAERNAIKSDWAYGAPYHAEMRPLNHKYNVRVGYDTPDANSTIRFTLSTVQDAYNPIYKKGKYPYSTKFAGLIAKDRMLKKGHPEYSEFIVPKSLISIGKSGAERYQNLYYFDKSLGDVPLNYITQHVITGGNSGSSAFNAKGEVVGFVFDGTPEAILSDVSLHPESRTIIVDIRYVGFLGDRVYPKSAWILKELGLEPRAMGKVSKR